MKKFLLGTVALVALGATVPALAADLPARTYTKAPVYAAPIYNWTGFYIGGHIGGAFSGDNNFGGLTTGNNNDGRFLGGLQGGYDYQFAPNWVLGVEAQYSWLGSNNNGIVFPGGYAYNNDQRGLGSVTGRLGYTWGPGLLYVKGGYGFSDNNNSLTLGRRSDRIRAVQRPSRWLHGWRRSGIHVYPELVGQDRISVLQLRQQLVRDPGRARSVRQLPHRRPCCEGRYQLSLQLGWPGRRKVLIRV